MVSLLGEDRWDERDYRMGLAGLLAGIHSLRILAERGIASRRDVEIAAEGIDQVFDTIKTWRPGEREHLSGLLEQIAAVAEGND